MSNIRYNEQEEAFELPYKLWGKTLTVRFYVDEEADIMNNLKAVAEKLAKLDGSRRQIAELLIDEGSITQEERRTHVHRNIIFPAFGNVSTKPKIDISPITGGTEYGDVLILCSDGLSDYVSPIDMEEIMELPRSLPERLQMLLEKASANQSKDNITVAAILCC